MTKGIAAAAGLGILTRPDLICLLVLPFLLAAAAHGANLIWYNSRGHD